MGSHVPFARLIANDGIMVAPPIDPYQAIALLQYTGGTTGVPKAAMLTHANLYANAEQCVRWFAHAPAGPRRILGVLPLFHVFAMTVIMNWALFEGAEMILMPRFKLEDLLRIIARKKPTVMAGVPTLFNAMLNAPDLARHDLSSLYYCVSGGAAAGPGAAHAPSRRRSVPSCWRATASARPRPSSAAIPSTPARTRCRPRARSGCPIPGP